jgi:hypothetical protein
MIEAPDIERLRSMVLEAEEQREASWPAILKLCLVVSGFKGAMASAPGCFPFVTLTGGLEFREIFDNRLAPEFES